MRRNMSYRKPAPVYVPSPPTSPAMDPICPSFLMANETDQLYQQNRPGTKEKPLPTIPATRTVRGAPRAKPLASSKGINVEPPPITRQASKARTTSSGALSSLNYCSDSENTAVSCISASNAKPSRRHTVLQRHQDKLNIEGTAEVTPPRYSSETIAIIQGYRRRDTTRARAVTPKICTTRGIEYLEFPAQSL
ncbi:hypothetical protein D9756_000442 [Leucocoprinus leucothites]|uniref:Uncharacterized protein n=1 Tax=Leucocoprinus leucothites TaxID=201217 RepID=A0A8H5GE54_9AGAR|nr:hypothetical protein D9756_000442 [Leucoagaricus leucothites]